MFIKKTPIFLIFFYFIFFFSPLLNNITTIIIILVHVQYNTSHHHNIIYYCNGLRISFCLFPCLRLAARASDLDNDRAAPVWILSRPREYMPPRDWNTEYNRKGVLFAFSLPYNIYMMVYALHRTHNIHTPSK